MADASVDDLIIPALSALASSAGGVMGLPDLATHLETRHGSSEQEAQDSRSPQSRKFQETVKALLAGPGSLVDQGYATLDETGARVRITEAGRAFIGR